VGEYPLHRLTLRDSSRIHNSAPVFSSKQECRPRAKIARPHRNAIAYDAAFVHMERDLECLNEMIGGLLTIARLDTAAIPVEIFSLDLTESVSRLVHNAGSESQKTRCRSDVESRRTVFCAQKCGVAAQPHRKCNSQCDSIHPDRHIRRRVLHGKGANGPSIITLTVRDFGTGVSYSKSLIFSSRSIGQPKHDGAPGGIGFGHC
jgi:hypothetical protein